jgi:aspartyl-tRNA synthetase
MESIKRRTHNCGELRTEHSGQTVTLHGWAESVRDKGGVMFLILRDRYGTVQITLNDSCGEDAWTDAKATRLEYVLEVDGMVHSRAEQAVNKNMDTGAIEVIASRVRILSKTKPMPFQISDDARASEEVRLQYRYLDLRRRPLQNALMIRHKAALSTRRYMDAAGFYEIETPILNRSTPEGARDYLVPSRVHPGHWYALPQSPQIFKQLLMVSGMDRYFQIVKCFRDEDLRADRQPEFTQIDVELSFATRELVIEIANGLVREVWKDVIDVEVGEIPIITYAESMARFGRDAPDMRFGMEHTTLDWAGSEFQVIGRAVEAGGIVKAMVVKGAVEGTSRKVIDGWTEFVRRYRLGGLLWGKVNADGWSGPLSKVEEKYRDMIPDVEVGDVVLVGAGPESHVHAGLGKLREQIARQRELIPADSFAFVWVVDFPNFEWDEDNQQWTSMHHPFTKPLDEHIGWLGTDKMGDILSDAYDLVCNGYEIGGGSIRIHDAQLQAQIFTALGLSEEEAKDKFGFLIDALQYGAPPHGGLAMGFDRWCMMLCRTENIRDVIAFPKTTTAQDLMAGAPNWVANEQLDELHVSNVVKNDESSND